MINLNDYVSCIWLSHAGPARAFFALLWYHEDKWYILMATNSGEIQWLVRDGIDEERALSDLKTMVESLTPALVEQGASAPEMTELQCSGSDLASVAPELHLGRFIE